MLPAEEALEELRRGNRRFVSDAHANEARADRLRRLEVAAGQTPFAIVLGCSDSRVPAEIVFDQGLGDLYVIRVAGNIVAPSQIASVEFAVEQFGTRLVVVLGHSSCGAVCATVDELYRPSEACSHNLDSIVGRIRPAVEPLMGLGLARDALVQQAVRANVRTSVNQLRRGSALLEELVRKDELMVIGAEYALDSGEVDFFDVPAAAARRVTRT